MSLEALVNSKGRNFFGTFLAKYVCSQFQPSHVQVILGAVSNSPILPPDWLVDATPEIKDQVVPVPFALLLQWAHLFAFAPVSQWRLGDLSNTSQPTTNNENTLTTQSRAEKAEGDATISSGGSKDAGEGSKAVAEGSKDAAKRAVGVLCKAAKSFESSTSLNAEDVFSSVLLNSFIKIASDEILHALPFRTLAALPVLLADCHLVFEKPLAVLRERVSCARPTFLPDWTETALQTLVWQPGAKRKVSSAAVDEGWMDKAGLHTYFCKAIAAAVTGARERHRHGASLYLRRDQLHEQLLKLGENEMAEKIFTATAEDLLLSVGHNTEVMTTNWKCRRQDGSKNMQRWKVLHAEIMALCKAAKNEQVLKAFFPASATADVKKSGPLLGLETPVSEGGVLAAEIAALLCTKGVKVEGCVGVVIAELDDNHINLDASQACPLCIKALKRWGLGEQIYTTDCGALAMREAISVDESLLAESLQGALQHFASPDENRRRKLLSILLS
eukprot:Gregarina_sp_Pseudo_9__4734@NODE_493_length_2714_cov_15_636262_g465_i0_p1_GENE_NODE_493_length_2714_cov_15_636262_g465_i0NODE_493_length_2714_cov_15_636262_g465_i0_p1_ORF_typecomplete_len502_score68_94dCMP_cyt_deam_1/PF00383_23/0_082_NODE_493_length_2714_cov_15_636262_g465_i0351540